MLPTSSKHGKLANSIRHPATRSYLNGCVRSSFNEFMSFIKDPINPYGPKLALRHAYREVIGLVEVSSGLCYHIGP